MVICQKNIVLYNTNLYSVFTLQLINLAIALMNALKQSFSQRAMRARSLGEKDKFTDLTLAAIDMGKVRRIPYFPN